jgi:hypothetical protein
MFSFFRSTLFALTADLMKARPEPEIASAVSLGFADDDFSTDSFQCVRFLEILLARDESALYCVDIN